MWRFYLIGILTAGLLTTGWLLKKSWEANAIQETQIVTLNKAILIESLRAEKWEEETAKGLIEKDQSRKNYQKLIAQARKELNEKDCALMPVSDATKRLFQQSQRNRGMQGSP